MGTRTGISYSDTRGLNPHSYGLGVRGFKFIDPETLYLRDVISHGGAVYYLTAPLPDDWQKEASAAGLSLYTRGRDTRTPGELNWRLELEDRHIDFYPASLWFGGAAFDSDVEPAELNAAFSDLQERIKAATFNGETGNYFRLRPTPAKTGVDLLRLKFRQPQQFHKLENETRAIIMSPEFAAPQHRIEVYRHGREKASEFLYYDMRQAYQWAMSTAWVPIGEERWDNPGRFVPWEPSWFLTTWTVPQDWNHVGLAHAPGHDWAREPGRTYTAWVCEPEARLICMPDQRAQKRDPSLPRVDQPWPYTIHKRISFVPYDTGRFTGKHGHLGAGKQGLRNFTDLVDGVEHGANPWIRAACRNIRYHMLGRLHPRSHLEEIIKLSELGRHKAKLENEPGVRISHLTNGLVKITRPGQSPDAQEAPQLSAYIWSFTRARVTRNALHMPFEAIAGIYGDAISTVAPVEFPYAQEIADPGDFRIKGHLKAEDGKSILFPENDDELADLNAEAEAAFKAARELESVSHGA